MNQSKDLENKTPPTSARNTGGKKSQFMLNENDLQLMDLTGVATKEQRLRRQKSGLSRKEFLYAVNQDDIIFAIPFGVFQIKIAFTMFLYYTSSSFLTYNMAFFLIEPDIYQCVFSVDPYKNTYPCTREYICNNDIRSYIDSWEANENADTRLYNWVDTLDLHCLTNYHIGLFGVALCAGMTLSSLCIPLLVQKYGRKMFTYLGAFLQILCYLVITISTNYHLYPAVLFAFGITIPFKNFITYPHLMEFVPRQQIFVGGLMRCIDGLVFSISPLILHFVTHNTKNLLYIATCLNIISIVALLILYVPESIKFNLSKGKYEEVIRDISFICIQDHVTNSKKEAMLKLIKTYQYQQESRNNYSALHFVFSEDQYFYGDKEKEKQLFNKLNVINLLLMMTCWIATKFTFFTMIFYVKYLPGDLFSNATLGGASAFIFLFQSPILQKLCPKRTQQCSFAFNVLCLISMFLMTHHFVDQHFMVYAVVFMCLRAGMYLSFSTIYTQHQDLFDQDFLGPSFAICTFVSRLFAVSGPMIAEVSDRKVPILLMILLNSIAFICTSLLVVRNK
ncbi:solute carrier family 22 member 4 [Stylonychia lemnae]|uniref:Solute carrier family 22 member 4 n=1 Tax=Stylonychia lemnae TaxID=5949 RepID=A0A078A5I5_STYLE|nr:solute carrier family 22 member 4 [Stylonychia lemnae]|eukprot:CDW77154.1 solute carrier family 22 member 4 [Stylonychia lemnae]